MGNFLLYGSRLTDYVDGKLAYAPLTKAENVLMESLPGAGQESEGGMRVVRALAAFRCGAPPELVARSLHWREFESFCAAVLRARGYEVRANLTITKPRAQIDLLASLGSRCLAIDCKRWAKGMGEAGLLSVVEAQRRRIALLRRRAKIGPVAIVVVSLVAERARFAGGGAVVPIYALADFLDNLPAYDSLLDFC